MPAQYFNGLLSPFASPTELRETFGGSAAMKASFETVLPKFPIVLLDLGVDSELDLRAVRARDVVAGCGVWLLAFSRDADFEERVFAEPEWIAGALEASGDSAAAESILSYTLRSIAARSDPRRFAELLETKLGGKATAMARNLAESLIEEGMRDGLEKGRREGRQEGRVEGLRRSILTVLATRFGALPTSLATGLQEFDDVDALERLVVQAAAASSLEEFVREIP
jgi:hypothetical protein